MISSEFKNILLCLRYGIGDVVMELPVIETMRRNWPNASVTGLGARPAIELLEKDPRIDSLAAVQDWGLSHWGDSGTPEIRTRIRQWLIQRGFDAILDPSHAVIAVRDVLWQFPCTIYDSGNPGMILREGESGGDAIKSAVYAGWGMKIPESLRPRLDLRPDEIRFARGLLRFYDMENKRITGIAPIASSDLKQWPVERFAAVADMVTDSPQDRILLFCGPQDAVCRALLERMKRPQRAVPIGAVHLRRVAALIRCCRFFLCNDTGLMHMAAGVKVPVAALFGPTSSRIYLPSGAAAVESGVQCDYRKETVFGPSDCLVQNRCLISSRSCIEAIQIDKVMQHMNLDSQQSLRRF